MEKAFKQGCTKRILPPCVPEDRHLPAAAAALALAVPDHNYPQTAPLP